MRRQLSKAKTPFHAILLDPLHPCCLVLSFVPFQLPLHGQCGYVPAAGKVPIVGQSERQSAKVVGITPKMLEVESCIICFEGTLLYSKTTSTAVHTISLFSGDFVVK